MRENTNTKTIATTAKTAIGNLNKPVVTPDETTATIYDAIAYVKSEEFHAELAEAALRWVDDHKVVDHTRPFSFGSDNRIWIITFVNRRVMGIRDLINHIKHMIDTQCDSKIETQHLQQMVDLDHLMIKKGRICGRPVLIVQLVED